MAKLPKAMLAIAAPVVVAGAVTAAVLSTATAGSPGTRALGGADVSVASAFGGYVADAGPARRMPGALSGASDSEAEIVGTHAAATATTGTLRAGSVLRAGKMLYSANREYALAMRKDGDLVVSSLKARRSLWSSQTPRNRGATAAFQPDGNLVVYSRSKHALWASGTRAAARAVLDMGNNGDLVIRSSAGGPALWSSVAALSVLRPGQGLAPGHALYSPSHAYMLVMQSGGNLVLRNGKTWLWSSKTGGHRGARAVYQSDGNFVIYSRTKHALWATGTRAGASSFLTVQNNGNTIIFSSPNGFALWATGTIR